MPLPFEARFVAKEYIDVFAYRAGKAGTALVLTAAGQHCCTRMQLVILLLIPLLLAVFLLCF